MREASLASAVPAFASPIPLRSLSLPLSQPLCPLYPLSQPLSPPRTLRQPLYCSTPLPATVIGAGVSGLAAARTLSRAGLNVRLLEASPAIGGRVATDSVDGYLLDRGFQVFIEAYPELNAVLGASGYAALDLRPFRPGAVVRAQGAFHVLADPFRAPLASLGGVFAPVGSLSDKIRVAALRVIALRIPPDALLRGNLAGSAGVSTAQFLSDVGFSDVFIDRFFRPFYEGIFLAPLGEQAATLFAYVFHMFAAGRASLPAGGIGALAEVLAADLGENVEIRLNTRVSHLSEVAKESSVVIVATDGRGGLAPKGEAPKSRGSICFYFAAPKAPKVPAGFLVLNGEGMSDGPVNNMFVPSDVFPECAPDGMALVSTTIVGDAEGSDEKIEGDIRRQMAGWFGEEEVGEWRFLKSYRVRHSQPAQNPSGNYAERESSKVGEGVFVCGDHTNTPTINGALESGRLAAEEALDSLGMET